MFEPEFNLFETIVQKLAKYSVTEILGVKEIEREGMMDVFIVTFEVTTFPPFIKLPFHSSCFSEYSSEYAKLLWSESKDAEVDKKFREEIEKIKAEFLKDFDKHRESINRELKKINQSKQENVV